MSVGVGKRDLVKEGESEGHEDEDEESSGYIGVDCAMK